MAAVLESAAELAKRVNADPVFKASSLYSERAGLLDQVGRMGANYLSFDFGGKALRFKVDRSNWDPDTSLVDSVDYESYPEDASEFRVWANSRAEQVRQIAKDRLLDGETLARIEGRLAAAEDPAQTNDLLRMLFLSRAANEACGSPIP